jgi:hypothetical protein
LFFVLLLVEFLDLVPGVIPTIEAGADRVELREAMDYPIYG